MRVNTKEWDRVFPVYAKLRRKDLSDILNTKLFYIAIRAQALTPKADIAAMQSVLGPVAMEMSHQKIRITKTKGVKVGKVVWRNVFAAANGRTIPRLGLIINARRRKKGEPQLFGDALDQEIQKEWSSRKRGIAYLKSGYLPGIRLLAPLALPGSKPAVDRSARQYGRNKGLAVAAVSWSSRAIGRIENFVTPKEDRGGALVKHGLPALQKAFAEEIASMKEYIVAKLAKTARRLNIKTKA